jgi:hypothetical protein
MKLTEIAKEIDGYLKRFENDPVINARDPKYDSVPYWNASAVASGRFVYISCVSYQGSTHLTKDQAEKYLDWLRQGNVGAHWKALYG